MSSAANPQGAGDRVRRHVQLERRPRIHDRQTGVPGRQAVPQLLDRDARHPETAQKPLALGELDRDVRHDRRRDDDQQRISQPRGIRHDELQRVTEQVAHGGPAAGPHERRGAVEQQELPTGDPDDTRQRRRDRAQAGKEFGDQQDAAPVLDERILGAPDARVRLERDPTQKTEDSTATPPPQLVPDDVGRERGDEGHTERRRQTHPPRPGERANAEQNGHRRNRQTDLLGQHEREQHDVAVLQQDLDRVVHRGVARPVARTPRVTPERSADRLTSDKAYSPRTLAP